MRKHVTEWRRLHAIEPAVTLRVITSRLDGWIAPSHFRRTHPDIESAQQAAEDVLINYRPHDCKHYRPTAVFVIVIALMTLLAAMPGIEATMWAVACRFVGALPDNRSAMLYSLNALTSYGHTNLRLDDRWHLMGAIEALNGELLFGLSTAFLFAVIGKVFTSLEDRREHDGP